MINYSNLNNYHIYAEFENNKNNGNNCQSSTKSSKAKTKTTANASRPYHRGSKSVFSFPDDSASEKNSLFMHKMTANSKQRKYIII